jgi:hypothetical protein
MKRPSFQFYPGDWSANPNLKRCTFAERGIWLEVMCLMHDQEPYGVLRWPLKEIALAVGCKTAELLALVRKGVLKGSDEALTEAFVYTPRSGRKDGEPVTLVPTQAGPIWYSSRMVKDEYVRTIRGEGGGNGDAPKAPPKSAPKPPIGEAFGPRDARAPAAPSSSSSSSTSVESASALSARADAGAPAPPASPPQPEPPTARGAVGIALKLAGLDPLSFNLADPRVDALIAAGATPEQWQGLAAEAVKAGKSAPWAWVLAVLPERLKASRGIKPVSRHAGFAAKDYRAGVTDDGFIAAS